MPLYEYRCLDCATRFEVLQAVGAGSDGVTCPRCGDRGEAGQVEKQFSTFSGGSRDRAAAVSAAPAHSCARGGCGCG